MNSSGASKAKASRAQWGNLDSDGVTNNQEGGGGGGGGGGGRERSISIAVQNLT